MTKQAIFKPYTENLFYQIKLTAKYLKLLGIQLFEGLGIDIPLENYAALDIINNNKDLCQRDLAKLILKDRANTGRIVKNLEQQGFVTVTIDKKSNRLVKLLKLTTKGKKFVENTTKRIEPYLKYVSENIDTEFEEKLIEMLVDLRERLSDLVETQI